jgi:hypothetical protein
VLIGRYLREDTETPNVDRARKETLRIFERAGFGPRAALLAESVFSTAIPGLTINGALHAMGHWQHGTDPQPQLVDGLEVANSPEPITEQEHRRFVLETTPERPSANRVGTVTTGGRHLAGARLSACPIEAVEPPRMASAGAEPSDPRTE